MLAARTIGAGDRLVLVHGFTQTMRSWAPVASALAERHEVVTVDAPGHGDSEHADADLGEGAALLAETAGRATYVGYSMGGRLCLQLAVDHPGAVARLVLIGASPGLDDEDERSARRAADDRRADHLGAVGLDAFLDEWLAQPLFAGLDDEGAGRDDRRRNDAGRLAQSLRNAGTGAQRSLWGSLGTVRCPVLLLVGALDAKFTTIAQRMLDELPQASVVVVEGAGHTVHLERPGATVSAIEAWLADHPPSASPIEAANP